MTSGATGWDWWSEVKLAILRDYLAAFTLACSGKSRHRITYLDLFAGSMDNARRHQDGTFRGSSRIALENEPPFTRLAFFELSTMAPLLREAIDAARPGDDRWRVFEGDCNTQLNTALAWLGDQYRWAPTFAFIDPRGLQVDWRTVQTLARWRHGDHKTELWLLFPEPALARVLGLKGVAGQSSAETLTSLYGSDSWVAVHQRRQLDLLSPAETRAHFVNLYRWQLEAELGYRRTHALQFVTTSGVPVYTMVFATDHDAGDGIMSHVYNHASARLIPEMRAQARDARRARRDADTGQGAFDLGVPTSAIGDPYVHTPVWEPLPVLDSEVILDSEPEEAERTLEEWLNEQAPGF